MTAASKIVAMSWADRATRAAKVAAEFADNVDVEGRFPSEG
ncbi:MAG: acyl-CoA dehydrogenase, partial [Roseibium sp.]|nr:acyl-CoA dehydrogenase [Roseibium sp.]